MKKPWEAPKLGNLMSWFTSGNRDIGELFKHAQGPTVSGEYLHWDQLRHRPSPSEISREEQWLLLKLHRQSDRKFLPLRAKDFSAFSYSNVDPIPHSLHEIDKRAAGSIQMPEQVTNPETRDQYYVSSLIEEA